MTKEELEKATGQELIDARNYCGVDGYYGDYLDNVNAEMLKRFNRLAELEKENAELKGLKDVATLIRANNDTVTTLMQLNNMLVSKTQQLTKAKEIIKTLLSSKTDFDERRFALWAWKEEVSKAEQLLKENE
jgi:hypothetical protein